MPFIVLAAAHAASLDLARALSTIWLFTVYDGVFFGRW